MLTRIPVFSRLSGKKGKRPHSSFSSSPSLSGGRTFPCPHFRIQGPGKAGDGPDWRPSMGVQGGKCCPDWNPLASAAGEASACGFPALKPVGLFFKKAGGFPPCGMELKRCSMEMRHGRSIAFFPPLSCRCWMVVIHLRIPIKAWEKKERLAVFLIREPGSLCTGGTNFKSVFEF